MNKHIPYEKLQKKERRKIAVKQRKSWGAISPVTRKSPNPKAYNRKKTPRWHGDGQAGPLCAV